VRRNLGDEVFERLIEPFCSGYNLQPSLYSQPSSSHPAFSLNSLFFIVEFFQS
jgi:hypothetical protein